MSDGEHLVGRLYIVLCIVGVFSLLAGGFLLFTPSAADHQAAGLCLIASALAFGLTMNAVARK